MLVGIGTDIHEVARLERELRKEGGGARDDLFTLAEVERCTTARRPAQAFASCFAVKEALLKALGTGWSAGLSWLDINVNATSPAAVEVSLAGAVQLASKELGVRTIHASITHNSRLVMASVLLEA